MWLHSKVTCTTSTKTLRDEKGNPVYVGQAKEQHATYGFATVELEQHLYNREEAEQALFLFLEAMHPSFNIENTMALSHGYTHPYTAFMGHDRLLAG